MRQDIDFSKAAGLVPAIVQDADTLQVLMLGYMNAEALEQTQHTGKVVFFSRSKGRLWMKGEESGNYLALVAIVSDCDRDTLLITARPAGPTCHNGTTSCFGADDAPGIGFLARLSQTIEHRKTLPETSSDASYVRSLFGRGLDRIIQKVGEEAVETVIAAKNEDTAVLQSEAADLLFHLLVLLSAKGLRLQDLAETLRLRSKTASAKNHE